MSQTYDGLRAFIKIGDDRINLDELTINDRPKKQSCTVQVKRESPNGRTVILTSNSLVTVAHRPNLRTPWNVTATWDGNLLGITTLQKLKYALSWSVAMVETKYQIRLSNFHFGPRYSTDFADAVHYACKCSLQLVDY